MISKGVGPTCALHVVATHRPYFLIEEDGASAARKRYLKENAAEAKAALEKEMVRRERKAAKAGAEEGEDGVESGDPDEDSC